MYAIRSYYGRQEIDRLRHVVVDEPGWDTRGPSGKKRYTKAAIVGLALASAKRAAAPFEPRAVITGKDDEGLFGDTLFVEGISYNFV